MHLPRPVFVPLAAAVAVAGLLTGPTSGSANNDPHRSFSYSAPFDVPAAACGFPVHLDFPIDNEYQTVTTLPDGSTVFKATGRLIVTATNEDTGKAITLNVSGPGTVTLPPDGTALLDDQGPALLYAVNGTQYGFPSNLVLTTGLLVVTFDATGNITTLTRQPSVRMDVCAALS